ncbi:termination factor Rho [Pseudomonas sp. EL_65y_Pfl2_R95]|uniref:termination factor Rho n=1 Tax=Pseudomonas sp. EL_65y_Pfl2_R95 TaxID=3088698 RepID=UPI0030D856A6
MTAGSKAKYTDKQKRKAEHIESSYMDKGLSESEAEARAWATVNKQSGGGNKAGGSGQKTGDETKKSARKSSAKNAANTRKGKLRPGQSFNDLTKTELLGLARKREIKGRSTMRKAELAEALQA